MSYLTSNFSSLSKLIDSKTQNRNSVYQPPKSLKRVTKPSDFFNLKPIQQEKIGHLGKQGKTKPLVLFVNLLMKNGKKTHALRVLAMALSLFKAKISKIKLEKHVGCLKQSSQSFHQYFFDPLKLFPKHKNFERQLSFVSSKITNYTLDPDCFNFIFSRKKEKEHCNSKKFSLENETLYLKSKKPYPFIDRFFRVFNDFYFEKKFFCGTFRNLKPLKINEKSKQFLSCFGKGRDIKKRVLKLSKQKQLQKNKIWKPIKKQTSKDNGLKNIQSSLDSFNKCLWYKALTTSYSWDNYTNAQKNSFLYCLFKTISNVKPPLECRTKRIGGSNKQIPSQVYEHRQWGIAIGWIIEAAQKEFSKKASQKRALENPVYKTNLKNRINTYELIKEKFELARGMLSQPLLRNTNETLQVFPLPGLDFYCNCLNSNLNYKRVQKLVIKKTVRSAPSQKFPKSETFWSKNMQSIKAVPCKLESWVVDPKISYICPLFQKSSKTGKLKEHFKKTKKNNFCVFLAESLENAYYRKGFAMQKRNLWIETALTNRAFLRYRWW